MLQSIYIRNFALIEELQLRFDKGFTVLTGETGSGKSIFLGALNLLLGDRADFKLIGPHDKKSIAEASFGLSAKRFEKWFLENDLDFETETLVRREISESGRSRAFINDTPVTLNVLQEFTQQLIFIHSQHATQSLRDKNFQRELVDLLSDNAELLSEYSNTYKQWKSALRSLELKEQEAKKRAANKDFLEFQVEELDALKLDERSFEDLEMQLESMSNREEIIQALRGLQAMSEDAGPTDQLKQIHALLNKQRHLHSTISELADRLQSTLLELDDLVETAAQAEDKLDGVELDIQELTGLVDAYNHALSKHRVGNQETLKELWIDLRKELSLSDHDDEDLSELRKDIAESESRLKSLASKLSVRRNKGARMVSKRIIDALNDLKMPDCQVVFDIQVTEDLNAFGQDEITMLFAPNKGMPLQMLHKTASGGELARLMLVLQQLTSEKKALPTILFDEIDTGVSGEVALKIGKHLRKMGETMQLFAITHLPQVAGQGQQHLKVSKSEQNEIVRTDIKILNKEERIVEIAGLMSGEEPTDAALKNAELLLS